MASFETFRVQGVDDGIRLDRWFKRHYPQLKHGTIEKALRKGWIKVENKKAASNFRLEEGHTILLHPAVLEESIQEIPRKSPSSPARIDKQKLEQLYKNILYEDENIIVLNKPAGLAVQGGSGVRLSVDDLLAHLASPTGEKPKLVHRLDKDTSGILLLARHTQAAALLTECFRKKTIKKTYWTAVRGTPPEKAGIIRLALEKTAAKDGKEKVSVKTDGKPAVTQYKVIHAIPEMISWLELIPVTGRTHQLRIHCAALGTPIIGDGKYGGKYAFLEALPAQLHLHAYAIEIPALFGKKPLSFTAPLPPHMEKTWKYVGFDHLLP